MVYRHSSFSAVVLFALVVNGGREVEEQGAYEEVRVKEVQRERFAPLCNLYCGDKIEEDVMGGACGTIPGG